MAIFAGIKRNVEFGEGVIGGQFEALARGHLAQSGLHFQHRQGASKSGRIDFDISHKTRITLLRGIARANRWLAVGVQGRLRGGFMDLCHQSIADRLPLCGFAGRFRIWPRRRHRMGGKLG